MTGTGTSDGTEQYHHRARRIVGALPLPDGAVGWNVYADGRYLDFISADELPAKTAWSWTPPADFSVEDYRTRVIKTVACPRCGAAVDHGCVKPARLMLRRTSVALRYVHDDRSAAFDSVALNIP